MWFEVREVVQEIGFCSIDRDVNSNKYKFWNF